MAARAVGKCLLRRGKLLPGDRAHIHRDLVVHPSFPIFLDTCHAAGGAHHNRRAVTASAIDRAAVHVHQLALPPRIEARNCLGRRGTHGCTTARSSCGEMLAFLQSLLICVIGVVGVSDSSPSPLFHSSSGARQRLSPQSCLTPPGSLVSQIRRARNGNQNSTRRSLCTCLAHCLRRVRRTRMALELCAQSSSH